jgi:hypothetical protein
MSRARLDIHGVWMRDVPWERNGEWRSDIFKTTLSDVRLKMVRYRLKGGPTIQIPASELRRIVRSFGDHYRNNSEGIWV